MYESPSLTPLSYRTKFAGPSVGTEQEFLGVRVGKKANGGSLLAEVVKDGELLVQVTTDIGGGGDAPEGYRGYTLELKTSPTEVSDDGGWSRRTNAVKEVLNAIGQFVLSKDDCSFTTGDLGEFEVVVHNSDHVVYKDSSSSGVTRSSKHATYGLPFAHLGTDESGAELVRAAGWYREWSVEFDKITGEWADENRARAVFYYLRSVLLKLTDLTSSYSLAVHNLKELKGFTGNLYDSHVKNKWGVLPRTAPWRAFDLLSIGDQKLLKPTLVARPNEVTDQAIWTAAVWHIVQGLDLAGHAPTPPVFTEVELPGTLFEFRSSIPVTFKHAFVVLEGESVGFAGDKPTKVNIDPSDTVNILRVSLKPPYQEDSDSDDSDSDD